MKQSFNPCDECNYSYSKNNQETGMCDICEFKKLLEGKGHHEMVHFKMVTMYRCKWCGKTFRSTRHKCMFDPKREIVFPANTVQDLNKMMGSMILMGAAN